MIEPLFGSGSPMWTAMPSGAFAYSTPMTVGNHSIASPVFGSSAIPGVAGGVSTGVQGMSTAGAYPSSAYSYGGGAMPAVPKVSMDRASSVRFRLRRVLWPHRSSDRSAPMRWWA